MLSKNPYLKKKKNRKYFMTAALNFIKNLTIYSLCIYLTII